jgi:hypothetical protein
MKILDALRKRGSPAATSGTEASSSDSDQQPIPGYDRMGHREIGLKMPDLSQVELAAVETYEQTHQKRPEVLAKVRYMLTTEPLPDYDTLSPEQIGEALVDADAEKVKAVRSYETKFAHRKEVLDEVARVLPDSPESAKEERSREEKAARVRSSTR